MRKQPINTPEAPAAVGAYNQGIIDTKLGLVHTSGQIALVPGEAGVLANGSIEEETHQIMHNLAAVLGAAGCAFADVYQSRIFIADQAFFAHVNAAYSEYFEEGSEPVRECVVAAPPLDGAHVEISMAAMLPE